MPRGIESPSPLLLADKGPELIMCNVIALTLSLDVGPQTDCDRGASFCSSSSHLHCCVWKGVQSQCVQPKEKDNGQEQRCSFNVISIRNANSLCCLTDG